MGTNQVNAKRKPHVQLNVRITPELSASLDAYCKQNTTDGKPMPVQLLVMQALASYIGLPDDEAVQA